MWLNEKVTIKRWHLILNNLINVPLVILVVHLVLSGIDKGSDQLDEILHIPQVSEDISFAEFTAGIGSGWIGIEARDVTEQEAMAARLDRVEGAMVVRVIPGSPSEKAEFTPSDIIVSFNGRKIRNSRQLQNDIAGAALGNEVKLCVVRDDYRMTLMVVPVEIPPGYPKYSPVCPWLGLEVAQINEESREWLALEEAGKDGGVVVVSVYKDGPAEKVGFLEKDIIMSFNNRKVTSLRQFFADLCGADAGDTARICLIRGDIRKTLYPTLAERPVQDHEQSDVI